ncbi:MAG: MotA/TolQ/ExbB proton channel family protein [Paracoccaceae bacterium]|jgi:biopolymer transport protein ExbB|nr:MotA/TolQ/ExbB proton channel family protein [Paracoccaceae bacterium]
MDQVTELMATLDAWLDSGLGAGRLGAFLGLGGPALWAIAALSVATLALVLWKLWRLARAGAWARRRAELFVRAWEEGGRPRLPEGGPRALRLRFAAEVAGLIRAGRLTGEALREEIARRAMRELAALRSGLRPLELVVTIAPLIGLLGTVLGMIEAFQALQETGARADPAVLAGGIWEALLTTAAGMGVAIPAAVALAWFEGVADAAQRDMEDIATRLVLRPTAEDEAA